MDLINKFLEHLDAMGKLAGKATDYPMMLCIYLGIFIICTVASVALFFSKYGNRVVWLPDQHKIIKSKFSYMAMLACTFTGVYLVGSFPSELQNTYGTWNADLFYTIGQTSLMLIAGIYSLATYKQKKSTILNISSIVIGISTSIPMAASTILAPVNLEGVGRIAMIVAVIGLIVVLAMISIKKNLLVKYSRINILIFIITSIALFTTISTFDNSAVDISKILPFQGMLNAEPWQEWLINPYWWYFEATVVSWSVFCGRFVAYCSNGYSVKSIVKYGTFSLIALTVVWHVVSAATGYTLSFSRGPVIYVLTALTMLAFAVTSLDSATKTLVNDLVRLLEDRNNGKEKINEKKINDAVIYAIMSILGVLNIVLLITGFPRLFTIILCLLFVPFFVRAMVYAFRFAFGKLDYSISGTITLEEFEKLSNEEKVG
jgi:choline-glycine betaine transporter